MTKHKTMKTLKRSVTNMAIENYEDEFMKVFGNPLFLENATLDTSDAAKALVFIAYQLAVMNNRGLLIWNREG